MKFKEVSWTASQNLWKEDLSALSESLSLIFVFSAFWIKVNEWGINFLPYNFILLLITLPFLGPIENIQEDAGQVKSTTKEIGQDVRQIKDDVTKIKGWYSFFSFFDVETRWLNYQQKLKGVQDTT